MQIVLILVIKTFIHMIIFCLFIFSPDLFSLCNIKYFIVQINCQLLMCHWTFDMTHIVYTLYSSIGIELSTYYLFKFQQRMLLGQLSILMWRALMGVVILENYAFILLLI